MRYAQLVMGPAGSGKSTYCSVMQQHFADARRTVEIVNLDPAAEHFDYEPSVDIRELIQLDDVMEDEDLNFGPNGGLIFCMEYLIENISWLQEKLNDRSECYMIFDCPGQLELYTHLTIMRDFIKVLQNLDFRICGVFLLDVQFMVDAPKFLSGSLAALSVMVNLAIPHVNVLNKTDLLSKRAQKKLESFTEPDVNNLLSDAEWDKWDKKYLRLTETIGKLVTDYSLVRFLPLNIKDEESVADVRLYIDVIMNYGEDEDVKQRDFEEPSNDAEN
ncbi:hypothetical protein DMN91_006109 [Ooceraea biroi]|uniref:GPN-loop GTPase 3 n=1 Tax=Ooceraea biroi TaxID=2015173 RepID=A0A026W0N9_OOCBI|nr:GPN-loop GTPase 3 [Ooceraea biroi]EZA49630.1 GPN-loop GTPase [Ooceraea biroi]RLU21733.1 hypothetical protein DMN91_006109 [Ooceraea biroi]